MNPWRLSVFPRSKGIRTERSDTNCNNPKIWEDIFFLKYNYKITLGKLKAVNKSSAVELLITFLWYNMIQHLNSTTERCHYKRKYNYYSDWKENWRVKERSEGTTHPRELLRKNNNTSSQKLLWNQLQANSPENLHENLLQPGGEKWGLSNLAQLWITSKD